MKLWFNHASPFARKARIAARETGLAGRIHENEVMVLPTKPNMDLARVNPLVKIPTLETDDGQVLYDSRVICEYLDGMTTGTRLFPASGAARWSALRRQALGDGIMDAGILRRYELAVRPEPLRWNDWLAGQLHKMDGALSVLEAEAGSWGNAPDIGHVTIACALGWMDFRFPDSGWRNGRPGLAAWFEGMSQRPSLKDTMPRA